MLGNNEQVNPKFHAGVIEVFIVPIGIQAARERGREEQRQRRLVGEHVPRLFVDATPEEEGDAVGGGEAVGKSLGLLILIPPFLLPHFANGPSTHSISLLSS